MFNPVKVKVYAVSLEYLTLAPSWTSSIFVQYLYVIVCGNVWWRLSAFLGTDFVYTLSRRFVHRLVAWRRLDTLKLASYLT